MSPDEIRANDLRCLATRALEALGVDQKTPDATGVMRHAIGQACVELEAVERSLERESGDAGMLAQIVTGIRQRLQFAAESGEMLASLVGPDSGAASERDTAAQNPEDRPGG